MENTKADRSLSLNGLKLDEFCTQCEGAGSVGLCSKCPYCDGTGYSLTCDGRTILDLIRRHLRVDYVNND